MPGGVCIGERAEQRRHRPPRDPVDAQMPVDHRGIGDREIGLTEEPHRPRGTLEGSRQPARVARMGTPAGEQVGYASSAVWTVTFVPWPEVVDRGGARRISVDTDHQRRAPLNIGCDVWVLELMEVGDMWSALERVADALLRRRVAVEKVDALMEADAGRALVSVDLRRQHMHLDPVPGERRGAGHDVRRHASISRPAWGHDQDRGRHQPGWGSRCRCGRRRSIAALITSANSRARVS